MKIWVRDEPVFIKNNPLLKVDVYSVALIGIKKHIYVNFTSFSKIDEEIYEQFGKVYDVE